MLFLNWTLPFAIAASLATCASIGPNTPSSALFTQEPIAGRVVDEIDPRIWHVFQARNGDYWFGSNGKGVYRFDGKQTVLYTGGDGLVGLQVRDIEEDRHGNIFISTNSGVSKFDGKRFTALQVVETESSDEGWELSPNDVWLVHKPGELGPCRYDGEKLYSLKLPKSPVEVEQHERFTDARFNPTAVYSIFRDSSGSMWFGTQSAGLCRFDGKSFRWMYEERLTTTPSGGAFGIRAIFEDRDGDFWICNTRQRFRFSSKPAVKAGREHLVYEKQAGLPDTGTDDAENFDYYQAILQGKSGAIWMAVGSAGVMKFDAGKVTRYPVDSTTFTFSLCLGQDGKLLVGTTDKGMFVFEGDGFVPFDPTRARK